MTIKATIIADSISAEGVRITTMQLRYQRFIHAEFMTHRVFSRNASSSRAIPVNRLIQDVIEDPAMPISWGKNQKGMQAGEENDQLVNVADAQGKNNLSTREEAWLDARNKAIYTALCFNEAGYHKQIVNRVLEPFAHINVLVTATEWANFFALRDHKDAQPEIAELARQMKLAMNDSIPQFKCENDWHLPYVSDEERSLIENKETLVKLSVARCARVSYLTHEGKKPTVEADLALYDALVGSTPLHASPAEHQATPDSLVKTQRSLDAVTKGIVAKGDWQHPHLHGNFVGWQHYRKTLPYENITA
jgi:thymidylate synthase ThyX